MAWPEIVWVSYKACMVIDVYSITLEVDAFLCLIFYGVSIVITVMDIEVDEDFVK